MKIKYIPFPSIVTMAGIRISQEICAIGMLAAFKPSLEHDRKNFMRL